MIAFLAELGSNPVFAGGSAVVLMSTLVWLARALPGAAWGALKRQFTVSLVIDNSDELFARLALYLSRSPEVARARWLRMVEAYDYEAKQWRWQPSFGLGFHLIRDADPATGRRHWFLLWRALDEKNGGLSLTRRETMTIRTLGKSQAAIRGLMARAERVYRDGAAIRVNVWHKGDWMLADYKAPRGFDTIFIPAAQKNRILADHDRWAAARETYRRRGTPWRRGYLFKGPTGTGKTSLALALASHASRPLYSINLATAGGDTGLLAAFNSAEAGALILLEDVDSASITHDREAGATGQAEGKDEPDKHVTLSGLLNVIDGLAARENRILVLTSNHAERLDSALLRPGRIDQIEEIGLMGRSEAAQMTAAFLGGSNETWRWFESQVVPSLPMAPAKLQGALLAYDDAAGRTLTLRPPPPLIDQAEGAVLPWSREQAA